MWACKTLLRNPFFVAFIPLSCERKEIQYIREVSKVNHFCPYLFYVIWAKIPLTEGKNSRTGWEFGQIGSLLTQRLVGHCYQIWLFQAQLSLNCDFFFQNLIAFKWYQQVTLKFTWAESSCMYCKTRSKWPNLCTEGIDFCKLKFDFQKDIFPVSLCTAIPSVHMTRPLEDKYA